MSVQMRRSRTGWFVPRSGSHGSRLCRIGCKRGPKQTNGNCALLSSAWTSSLSVCHRHNSRRKKKKEVEGSPRQEAFRVLYNHCVVMEHMRLPPHAVRKEFFFRDLWMTFWGGCIHLGHNLGIPCRCPDDGELGPGVSAGHWILLLGHELGRFWMCVVHMHHMDSMTRCS